MGKFNFKKNIAGSICFSFSLFTGLLLLQSCSGTKATTEAASVATGLRAPYAPNQVVLTAGSSRQINLTWADNSADETGFRIERAISNAGPFTAGTGPAAFTSVTTVNANVTSYSDMSLTAGTFYYYRIYAVNSAGSSAPTIAAMLQTPAAAAVAPAAPSGLTAVTAAASIINLSWLDNSVNENSFNLERSVDNGATFTLIAVISANTTTYQDINLLELKAYTYRLKAVNDAGASALTSNAVATTLAAGNTALFSYVNTNIIVPNCVKCHGGAAVSGGVNLSTYNGVRAVVVAGSAATSKLYQEVSGGQMPPAGPLSAVQISAIRNWINAGAGNN